MTAGVTKRNITTQSSATPISFVSGVEKSIHNPKNASGLSKQGQPQFKPKSKCFVHGKGNHTSEQCKVLKRITTANTATTTTKITLLTSSKKNCYKCSANILWNPGHATTCSRDKVERFNGPTKTFHSARFSCVHNRSKPSPAAVNLNDQEYNHGNMDIDLSSLPTNYDYSGASFSSIDITFANKNNININNNVSSSIIFATNDNKGKRLGTTSKALSLIYGNNDDALIHTSHIFEVFPLSFNTDAIIDLDLMYKLNILITNLAEILSQLSEVTDPLYKLRFEGKLTSKVWGQEQDDVFTKIKQLLASAPVLYHLDFNEPFYVATDASNYFIGAALYQVIDKQICHLGFMARALTTSEKNCSTTEQEPLAIVFALKKPGIQNVLPDMLSRLFETEKTLVRDKNQHKTWITLHIVNSKNTNMTTRMMMPVDLVTPAPEERQELLLKTHLEGHRGSQAMITTLIAIVMKLY
ncbi:hypothetical protein G6F43_003142 [Rhizopus delemar]|nr:hypothetical protein G6F43_003142 [Rhizopus delemar]